MNNQSRGGGGGHHAAQGVPDPSAAPDLGRGAAPAEPPPSASVEAMAALFEAMATSNRERLTRLAQQGVALDLSPLVISTWLEVLMEAIGGHAGVLTARVRTQQAIAAQLTQTEQQVARARLLAPPENGNHAPPQNGNHPR